jgi:hypothetical protein
LQATLHQEHYRALAKPRSVEAPAGHARRGGGLRPRIVAAASTRDRRNWLPTSGARPRALGDPPLDRSRHG